MPAEQMTKIRVSMGVEGGQQAESEISRIASGLDRAGVAAERFNRTVSQNNSGIDRIMRQYGDAATNAATKVERELGRMSNAFAAGRFEKVGGLDTVQNMVDAMVQKFAGAGPAVQAAMGQIRAAVTQGVGTVDVQRIVSTAVRSDAATAQKQADAEQQATTRQAAVTSFQHLEQRLNPAAGAAARFAEDWRKVNEALAAEPALAARASAAIDTLAKQHLGTGPAAQVAAMQAKASLGTTGGEEAVRASAATAAQVKATNDLSKAHEGGASNARMYAIQLIQTASSLEGGLPVGMVAVQQGHQMLDIYLSQQKGATGLMGALKGLAGAMFSIPGAFVAIGAAAAVALYSFNSQQQRMVELRDGLRLYTTDFAAAADRIKANTSALLPQLPARSKTELDATQQQFLQIRPDLSDAELRKLTQSASALAKVMGGDLKAATDLYAKGLRDPAAVANEMAQRNLPQMSEQLRRQINNMQQAGDKAGAMAKLYAALGTAVGKTESDISPATKAWQALNTEWRSFSQSMEGPLATAEVMFAKFFTTVVHGAHNVRDALKEIRTASSTMPGAISVQSIDQGIPAIALPERSSIATAAPRRFGGLSSGYRTPDEDLATALARRESGGQADVVNRQGYVGLYQYGTDRLRDVKFDGKPAYTPGYAGEGQNEWAGSFNIPGFDNVRTLQDFRKNAAAQQAVFMQDYKQVQALIDKLDPSHLFDQEGLHALAHIGGTGAMQTFVRSGGKEGGDVADANGTRRIDYYREFSRGLDQSTRVSGPAPTPNDVGGSITRATVPEASTATSAAERLRDAEKRQGEFYDASPTIPLEREKIERKLLQLEKDRREFEAMKPANAGELEHQNETLRINTEQQNKLKGALYDTIDPAQQMIRQETLQNQVLQQLDPATRMLTERHQQLDEAMKRTTGSTASSFEHLQLDIQLRGQLSKQIALTLHDNELQATANDRMASSYERGNAAVQAAENREKAIAEVRKAGLDPLKEGAAQVDILTASYQRLTKQQAEASAGAQIFQGKQQLDTINTQRSLVGQPQAVQDRALAEQRVLQSDAAQTLGADDPKIQQLVAEQKAIADANTELKLQQASWQELEQTGSRALDTLQGGIEKAFTTGKIKDFATAGLKMLQDLAMEGLKLSLMNPLKNWIFGTNAPTIGSTGGLLGNLFGGNKGGGSGGSGSGGSGAGDGLFSRLWNWLTGGSSKSSDSSGSSPFDASGFGSANDNYSSSGDSAFDAPGFNAYHSGGLVAAANGYSLPASVWAGARRFHEGTDLSDDPDAPTGADEYGKVGWFGDNSQNTGGVKTTDDWSADNQDRGPGSVLGVLIGSLISSVSSAAGSAISSGISSSFGSSGGSAFDQSGFGNNVTGGSGGGSAFDGAGVDAGSAASSSGGGWFSGIGNWFSRNFGSSGGTSGGATPIYDAETGQSWMRASDAYAGVQSAIGASSFGISDAATGHTWTPAGTDLSTRDFKVFDNSTGTLWAPRHHTGGMVGSVVGDVKTPAVVWDDAPRFHKGWAGNDNRKSAAARLHLAYDEIPAILQKGEVVLTRAQQGRVGHRRIASVLHQGGMAGTGTDGLMLPETVWHGAPKFHDGSDLTDTSLSMPMSVVPSSPSMPLPGRSKTSDRDNRDGDKGRVVIHAPININGVRNVQEFANSHQQIRAMAARAIGRASRSL